MEENKCRIESILNGIGKLLIGVAAIIGACAAKDAATSIKNVNANTNANSNTTNINLDLEKLCKDYSKLNKAAENPEELKSTIQTLPEVPMSEGNGIFIEGKYKGDLLNSLGGAQTSDQRTELIQKYYQKSLNSFGGKVELKATKE